jgi:predicted AlkP superfamily phosphohydrolase/phosphomutase
MKPAQTLTAILIGLAVVAVAAWYLTSKSPRTEQPAGTASRVHALAKMADYRDLGVESRHKVVVIGLDGATWDILDPMIAEGLLPTFERLKREGSWGALRSVDCYMSPPAWTSMFTGFLSERTGIYTFGKWNADQREFVGFSSLDVEVPHVWDIASRAGRRVAVTNVPLTYPTLPVNGIMVSGLMTPIVYRLHDPPRAIRLEEAEGPFDEDLDSQSWSPRLVGIRVLTRSTLVMVLYDTRDDGLLRYDTVALKVFATGTDWSMNDDVPVVTFSPNEFSPFFQIDYRMKQGDKRVTTRVACSVHLDYDETFGNAALTVTPLLRVPTDPDLRMAYPESLAGEIEDEFGYYLITMTHTPDLIPQGTRWTADFASYFYGYDDWDLFLYVFQAPDNAHHADGTGDIARAVYQSIDGFLDRMIDRLPEDATLVLASDHGFARYDYVVSLNDYLAEVGVLDTPRNIDHDRTLVFHNQWCLYFNESLLSADELARRGIDIARGQTPRQALVGYLKEKCRRLTSGERAMPIDLVEVPEDAAGVAPDMIVIGAYTDYFVEGADLDIVTPGVVHETRDGEGWFHSRNGMYLIRGNQTQRGVNGGVKDIQDITPTILYLLDLPLARDFDGRVWEDIIRPEILSSKVRYTVDDYVEQSPDKNFTFDELQSLEDKLRSLGYIR